MNGSIPGLFPQQSRRFLVRSPSSAGPCSSALQTESTPWGGTDFNQAGLTSWKPSVATARPKVGRNLSPGSVDSAWKRVDSTWNRRFPVCNNFKGLESYPVDSVRTYY